MHDAHAGVEDLLEHAHQQRIPVAFLAGMASVVFPCVLPLVPGYLSTVSAIEASRLGQPGTARRVAVASLPFFLGFITHNTFMIRLLKVCRLLRLSRLGRFSRAWSALAEALNARMYELLLSVGVAGLLLLLSSAFLYAVEAAAQPEEFGSVPRA